MFTADTRSVSLQLKWCSTSLIISAKHKSPGVFTLTEIEVFITILWKFFYSTCCVNALIKSSYLHRDHCLSWHNDWSRRHYVLLLPLVRGSPDSLWRSKGENRDKDKLNLFSILTSLYWERRFTPSWLLQRCVKMSLCACMCVCMPR